MANTEENVNTAGRPGPDAAWLSDLSLSGSRQRGVPEVEMAIMRLCAHPELLHRFLGGDRRQAVPPAVVLIHDDRLLLLESVQAAGRGGGRWPSRAGAYLVSRPGTETVDSLPPQIFLPSLEDARWAIPAEPGTSPRDESERGGRLMLAMMVIAIMLFGVVLLA